MRLLNAQTKTLEEFFEKDIPPYAILSHTWSKDEVLFKDIMKGRYTNDSEKIEGCCREALKNGLDYVWIDTCCIDKRSSAELSEAINSMFVWYARAKVCYAYLSDVHDTMNVAVPQFTTAFRKSKWWTRGWTLQELLAPRKVEFYSASWTHLGGKFGFADNENYFGGNYSPTGSINSSIAEITGIGVEYLNDPGALYQASVAEKMSWAAQRQTTRLEDVAYSLLGIFEVNMPLLYGEGDGAFRRLQETIISCSDDQSIFVWRSRQSQSVVYANQFLATSPSDFRGYGNVVPYTPRWRTLAPYSMTNIGLQIFMPLRKIPGDDISFIGLLNCAVRNNEDLQSIAIILVSSPKHAGKITMAGPFITCNRGMVSISPDLFQYPDNDPAIPLCIRSDYIAGHRSGLTFTTSIGTGGNSMEVIEVFPPTWYPIVDGQYILDRYERKYQPWESRIEELVQQTIYLHCLLDVGKHFIARLVYGFKVARDGYSPLCPTTMETAVAEFEGGQSLAETLIVHSDQVDMGLNWQQKLDLGVGYLKFRLEKEDMGPNLKHLPLWILHPEISRTRTNQAKTGLILQKARNNTLEDIPAKPYLEGKQHLASCRFTRYA